MKLNLSALIALLRARLLSIMSPGLVALYDIFIALGRFYF